MLMPEAEKGPALSINEAVQLVNGDGIFLDIREATVCRPYY